MKNNYLIKSKLKKERFEYQIMLSIFEKDVSFLDSYFKYNFKKMDLGLGNFKTNVKNRDLELSSGSMVLSNNANNASKEMYAQNKRYLPMNRCFPSYCKNKRRKKTPLRKRLLVSSFNLDKLEMRRI